MTRRTITTLGAAFALTLALAACSGSGSSAAPSAAGSPGGGAAACTASNDTPAVPVSIKGFAFAPAQISASVGQVIGFSNGDTAGHTATLDDGSCSTGTIAGGAEAGLVFTKPGTYPFHCAIHSSMKGTITVS